MLDPHLRQVAEEWVKARILGRRKGLPYIPAYIHSLRVEQLLKDHGLSDEVCLAGLLHDIIEDSKTTEVELAAEGFPEDVIRLIKLCSHDKTIVNRDLRWMLMIVGLVRADNPAAWSIKIADVLDNLKESRAMKKDRADFMIHVKIPVILEASRHLVGESSLWLELQKTVLDFNK